MKHITPVILFIISYSSSFSQQTDYFYTSELHSFGFVNDVLYLTYPNSIRTTSASMPQNPTTLLFTNISYCQNLLSHNDEIYFADFISDVIYKFSPDDAENTLTAVADFSSIGGYPNHLLAVGNEIYVTQFNVGKVSKITLEGSPPYEPEIVLSTSENGPNALIAIGDYIYLTLSEENKIVKFHKDNPSGTLEDVATADHGISWPKGLVLIGEEIYVSCLDAFALKKFNINDNPPVVSNVAYLDTPSNLVVHEDYLYIGQRDLDKIVRIPLSSLATDSFLQNPLNVSPNPATDYIGINNSIEGLDGYIVNVQGQIMSKFRTLLYNEISVRDFSRGTYIIKIQGNNPFKFIKK